ncbi:MAG: hypothetical protein J5950_01140 [Clostridia bacterium]|nr:hypothetical protein [Clostridia bacterium]
MKKVYGVIKTVLIVAAVLILVHFILRWKPLDEFLTSKIGGPGMRETLSDTLIGIDGYHDLLPEAEKPYVFSRDGKLYTLYKGAEADITPAGVSYVFYDEQSGLREKVRYRDHACFDEESGKLLFVVDVQGVPKLFLADLSGTSKGAVCVAENVDSFLFLNGEPVFAEGYSKFNSLNIYRDGSAVRAAENATYLPVPEISGMLCVSSGGELTLFESEGMHTFLLSDSAADIRGYGVFGRKLLVYSGTGDNYLSVIFDIDSGKLVRSVIDRLPEICCPGEDSALLYDPYSGKISSIDGDGQTNEMFAGSGRIYKVFSASFDEQKGGFDVIFANKKGIYKGVSGSDGEKVSLLCAFKGELKRYASHPSLITYHLDAGGDFEDGFYVMALSDRSFIMNSKNPLSWLNRMSSYVYKLMYVSNGKAASCAVPLSRTTDLPETVSGDNVLYCARFAGGNIKSVSMLDSGKVLCKDALKSDGMANGSSSVNAEIACGKVFISVVRNDAKQGVAPDYCVLEGDYMAVSSETEPFAVSFGDIYGEQYIGR